MSLTVVPIRVRIGLTGGGAAKYPDFNQLASVQSSGLDWSIYVDRFGAGWCYDKSSGHRDESTGTGFNDSPHGTQWGCLLVPAVFAAEAVAMFGAGEHMVALMTEAQYEQFYDTKGAAHLPEDEIDQDVMTAIRVKLAAGIPLTTADQEAIDRTNRRPGIRINRKKRWATRKVDEGIVIT